VVDFADNPRFPPRVRARLRVLAPIVERRFESFRDRMGKTKWEQTQHRLQALVESAEPVWIRLRGLYQLIDEAMAFAESDVACRRGCTHCCHIGVAVAQPEAHMLGAAIRRPPKSPRATDLSTFDYGYHNPCTFLRDRKCSIYEHRPLSCRVYVSLDEDALLCELVKDVPIPVPNLDMRSFQWAYMLICGGAKIADIRQYFPPS
jgi:hypothetical protein